MALHIPWDLEEVELNPTEIERKRQAYTAVAAMSPAEFRHLIDGFPRRDISHEPEATYPPRQTFFDFYRDTALYRPFPGRK